MDKRGGRSPPIPTYLTSSPSSFLISTLIKPNANINFEGYNTVKGGEVWERMEKVGGAPSGGKI